MRGGNGAKMFQVADPRVIACLRGSCPFFKLAADLIHRRERQCIKLNKALFTCSKGGCQPPGMTFNKKIPDLEATDIKMVSILMNSWGHLCV